MYTQRQIYNREIHTDTHIYTYTVPHTHIHKLTNKDKCTEIIYAKTHTQTWTYTLTYKQTHTDMYRHTGSYTETHRH